MCRIATTALCGLMILTLSAVTVTAEAPANDAFAGTWERTDRAVLEGIVARTWMWGPEAFTPALSESYAEAPNGERTVQYFDKSRMEITNPDADPDSIWYVTNGLLVVELMTGQMQLGDNSFQDRSPAAINVAGDANDPTGPTYATFGGLRDATPLPFDQPIIQRVDRGGNVTQDDALASHDVQIEYIDTVTTHTIAGPFWEFMNSSGTVWQDGGYAEAQLFENAFFATGRPITEPYWANVLVAGTPRDVLMQCFERRCLTYTPGNSEGFVVEAGNSGQHYYAWRYEGDSDPGPEPPPGASDDLQCVQMNYPCTLAETPLEVLQQIDAYGAELLALLDGGGSVADAEAWLLQQPDVVMTSVDDNALWYRLEGGPVVWLYDAPPGSPLDETAALSQVNALTLGAGSRPQSVVGQQREPGSDKRALILSPYKWYFGNTDEGRRLRDMLQAEGYEVDYRENPSNPSEVSGVAQVWMEHFQNWSDYDVVHVSTHGSTDCDLSDGEFACNSSIDTGIWTSAEDSLDIEIIGATIGQVEGDDDDFSTIALTADFFQSEYGSDPFATPLENTLVFFSACETFDVFADVPAILAGQSSAFLGWTESVYSGDAGQDALAIYEHALATGLPLNEAVRDLVPAGDALGTGRRQVPDAEDSSDRSELDYSGAGHIRLREGIDILNPISGGSLGENDVIPIFGDFGDGNDDRIPFRIGIDGIRVPEGTSDEEGWLSQIVVHVEIEGAGPELTMTLADDSAVGVGLEWELSGELPLGRDADQREQINIRAWVELPEGPDCVSRDEVAPRLDNPVLEFTSIIESIGGGAVSLQSEVHAEFTLVYTSDLSSLEVGSTTLEYVRYDIEVVGASGCEVVTTLHDGTLEITYLEFPTDDDGVVSSFVPEEVRLRPLTDIFADVTIVCPQGSLNIPGLDIHWFAGWVVAHGGQGGSGGAVDEFDESEGVWVIQNWQDEPPRKVYDQTIPLSGEVTLFEDTRIEITLPD